MVLTLGTTEGQADPVLPALAYKYEMKHAIQSLLLLSTGIIQIPASCNTQDNDDGSPQHTSQSRSRPVGNKDISEPSSGPTCLDKFLNRVTVS